MRRKTCSWRPSDEFLQNNMRTLLLSKKRDQSHEKIKYSRITPQMYIGTNMCCFNHFAQLQKLGVDADIDLENERVERFSGKTIDMLLWLPTADGRAPAMDKLIAGVHFMDAALAHGKTLYLHCKNGHGRAPTLAAAYFVFKGMRTGAAVKFIKSKRSVVHLNVEQMDALKKFERIVKKEYEMIKTEKKGHK